MWCEKDKCPPGKFIRPMRREFKYDQITHPSVLIEVDKMNTVDNERNHLLFL